MASLEVNGTPADTLAPPQVSNLIVTNTGIGNTLQLTWDASPSSDFSYYRIYRNGTLITTRTTTSYTDTGLLDGRRYFYRISAVDDGGPLPNEGLNSTAISAIPTDTQAPLQITGVIITVIPAGNQLNITWTPSLASDFVSYWLFRNITATTYTRLANLTVNYYLDTGLINLKTYNYMICARDEVPNVGANSTPESAMPRDTVIPPAVSTLTVTVVPTGNTLTIAWNLVISPDMSEYRIYRATSPGFTPSPASYVNTVLHPLTSYLDTGLTDTVTYYYKVLAVDDDGNYAEALTQRSGTPQDTVPPLQPASINVTNINGSLLVTWTRAQEDDFTKYEVWRNGSWILIQTITDKYTNFYLDPSDNLFDTKYYIYEIRVFDEVGYNNTAAPKVSIITKPSGDNIPPADVTTLVAANYGLGGNIQLTWTAPASLDIIYYKVYRSLVTGFIPNVTNFIGSTTSTIYYDFDPNLNGTGLIIYYYRVLAVDEANNTATGGNEAPGIPIDRYPPSGVLTFKVQSQLDGSIKLFWTANTPPDFISYNIYRRQDVLSFQPTLSDLITRIYNNQTLTYIESQSNLLDGKIYAYCIAVADEVGDSPTYGTGYNSTNGDVIPPSAPTGLVVVNEGTGDILNITWALNPEPDVKYYKIYRNSTFIVNIVTNFYQDKGLNEYYTYIYFITAVDEKINEGLASNQSSGIPIDIKAPAPPEISLIFLSGDSIFLVIKDLYHYMGSDVKFYYIYRANVSGGPYTYIGNRSKTGESSYYEDKYRPPGLYFYVVTALDEKLQESFFSPEVNITVPLFAPEWVNIVDNGNGDLTLIWTDNPLNYEPSIYGYRIYRMISSQYPPVFIKQIQHIPGKTNYNFTDYGIQNGNWSYYLTTLDKYNTESNFTEPFNLTVFDIVAPGPPTGLYATYIGAPGSPNFTLSWIPPVNETQYGSDVTYYEVFISPTAFTGIPGWAANATVIGRLNVSISFFNLPDKLYYIIVIANDEHNYRSSISIMINYTVDTTDPSIIPNSITDVSGLTISAGQTIYINVTVFDLGGIYRVYLNYTINGVPSVTLMELVTSVNGSSTYQGTILAPTAGSTVEYYITIFDLYRHSTSSSSITFKVIGVETPWPLIIILIGAIAGAAIGATVVVTRIRSKGKKKEYVAEELLPLPI
jgi:fibronectin type 3 domain-containing protein